MAIEATLFLGDKLHATVLASSIASATSTEPGYNRDLVRETDMSLGWKPDDGIVDEYLQADLGSTGAMGANPALAYVCIAYDARGAEQTAITLSGDDNGAGPWTNRATFTLNTTEPCCDFASWTVPATPDRYFRLEQLVANRGTGIKTAKILSWAMFTAADVYRIGVDFASDTTGPGALDQRALVSELETMTRQSYTVRSARPQQEFDLVLAPGTMPLWEALRDKFYDHDGSARAIYMQFDGLRNVAKSDFGMVRLAGSRYSGYRSDRDQYETTIRFTCVDRGGGGVRDLGAGDAILFDDAIF